MAMIAVVSGLVFFGCRPEPPATGAVVESCGRGEAAEVAGLRPGDVVVGWRHGDASGEIKTPFHMSIVEQETVPFGPVELQLRRNGSRMSLSIPTGRWRAGFRPVLDGRHLDDLQTAKTAEESGAFETAAEAWRALAEAMTENGRDLDAAFFQARRAVALARADRSDDCTAVLNTGAGTIADGRLRAAYWEDAGASLLSAGRMREAGHAFNVSIGILEDSGPDSPGMAHLQLQLCRSNYRKCEDEPVRAFEIYRRVNSASIELAQASALLGVRSFFRSDLAAAEEHYRVALDIVRTVAKGSPAESEALGNLGLAAMRRGDFATAREFYSSAMAIAESLGPGTLQYSHAANYLGLLAKKVGHYELARLHYERALASFRLSNPEGPEVAGILTNLGNVALREMDFEAARRYHDQAIELRRRLDPTSADLVASLHNVGTAARKMGDLRSARHSLEQALELKLEIAPGTGWLANTLFELGQVAREERHLDEAEDHHLQALEIRRRISPRGLSVAESLFALGGVEQERGRAAEAERLWREAIAMTEDRRRRLQLPGETQGRFGAIYDSQYGSLARLLIDTGRIDEAWNTLEMARAAYLRSIITHRTAAPSDISADLWFSKARAESRITRLESRLARVHPIEEAAALQRYREQLASVETELEDIAGQIREVAPRHAELEETPALTLAELRQKLDPGTVVVSYTVGLSRSMVMVTGSARDGGAHVQAFTIPVDREELRSRVERFNSLISRGRTVTEVEPAVLVQAERLFEMLVHPAWSAIRSAERVLIVPDGPLHELAFAALVIPGEDLRFFGHAKGLFVNPSASLAVELGTGPNRRSKRGQTIVAFGDPNYPPASPVVKEHHLEPLPGSRAEVEAIGRLFGDRATVLLGAEASEAGFKRHAARPSILHCAVHSKIDPSVSMDSALFFSQSADPGDSPEGGVLTAWEIADTSHMDVDLVVLSACSTARGRVVPGEGIIGLARAFQFAGARAVVVSQWAVPDSSTVTFMGAFYEQLAVGRSTVEALRRAQQVVGGNPELAHPYHWASFQVRGDWR